MNANVFKNKSLHTLLHWEFWPSYMFYLPNVPYGLYLAFKAKNIVFFTAANPAIKSSGNGTESKFATLQIIPEAYKPKSVLHKKEYNFDNTLQIIQKEKMLFPLIIKPDIGFRGLLVQKISSEIELKNYVSKYPIDFIIQEFIDFKNECGIFFSKNPSKKEGTISSITLKKFLAVLGDGKTPLHQLITSNYRTNLYKASLFKTHKEKLSLVLSEGEELQLSVIGNHSKGTQFINGNHLINNNLVDFFNKLMTEIPGIYYGRIDLKYDNFSELEKGLNFKILEINGIISEPTHIYDATNSTYFKALKAIRNHWKLLFDIANTNHKVFEIPYKSSKVFVKELIYLRKYSKKIASLQHQD